LNKDQKHPYLKSTPGLLDVREVKMKNCPGNQIGWDYFSFRVKMTWSNIGRAFKLRTKNKKIVSVGLPFGYYARAVQQIQYFRGDQAKWDK